MDEWMGAPDDHVIAYVSLMSCRYESVSAQMVGRTTAVASVGSTWRSLLACKAAANDAISSSRLYLPGYGVVARRQQQQQQQQVHERDGQHRHWLDLDLVLSRFAARCCALLLAPIGTPRTHARSPLPRHTSDMDRKRKLTTSSSSSSGGGGGSGGGDPPAKRARASTDALDGNEPPPLPRLDTYQSFHMSLRLNQLHRELGQLRRRSSELEDRRSQTNRVVAALASEWNQVGWLRRRTGCCSIATPC